MSRPSSSESIAREVAARLGASPALDRAEVLRVARALGYQGGKTTLWRLVKKLRARGGGKEEPR